MADTKPKRRNSLRLKGYDYTQPGAYFVTTVTHQRACLFGDVVDGEMQLNHAGKIVHWEWERLAHHFDFIELGAFVVMPNHFHGIIILQDVGAPRLGYLDTASKNENLATNIISRKNHKGSPLHAKGSTPKSLSAIIGQLKSRVTKRIHKTDEFPPPNESGNADFTTALSATKKNGVKSICISKLILLIGKMILKTL
ncbi:MAG: hypothetical protein HN855_17000 [Anaerolineae bacterium]|jgi:putative transposase|nr:hypothetical protein [Anaerolineae bacterium]MBT7072666.1 hypothetical protein [Anaerolineae bacterium]MBT7326847.1 hypothetical protein [Anaerolineae bacterium]